ncbi:6-O-methylguanine DNA methyltransferase [Lipomyces doorenjongii]
MPKNNIVSTVEYAVSECTPLDYLLIARELSRSPSKKPIKYLAIGSSIPKLKLEMRNTFGHRTRRPWTFTPAPKSSDLHDILARVIQRYVNPRSGSLIETGEDEDTFARNAVEPMSDAEFVESVGGVDLSHGTEFQRKVWQYLISECPRTECRSYQDLSMKLFGDIGHSRAIGNACAYNRIALLVPCHRVVRRGPTTHKNDTSGYRWERWRKEKLLDWELGGGLMTLAARRLAV